VEHKLKPNHGKIALDDAVMGEEKKEGDDNDWDDDSDSDDDDSDSDSDESMNESKNEPKKDRDLNPRGKNTAKRSKQLQQKEKAKNFFGDL